MNHLLSLSIITLLLASYQSKNLPTFLIFFADYKEVKISQTTEDQIAKIKSKLKSVSNIDFDYSQTLILSRWSCTDNENNGSNARYNRGTAYTDLITLQFNYFGFRHNHGGNQSTTFRAMN